METKELISVIDKLGGRKMLATILVLLAGGITIAFKGDVPANYLALLQTAMGAFVGGNIAEHWAKNIKAAREKSVTEQAIEAAPNDAIPAMAEQITAIEGKVNAQTELIMAVGQSVHGVTEILASAKARAK